MCFFVWQETNAPGTDIILCNLIENLVMMADAANLDNTEDKADDYGLDLICQTVECKLALINL